jgi:hypothetical protein
MQINAKSFSLFPLASSSPLIQLVDLKQLVGCPVMKGGKAGKQLCSMQVMQKLSNACNAACN